MDLRQKIEFDLKEAMRASDDMRRRTLRMVLAGIKLAEVEKREQLNDQGVIAVIQKEVKTRREAIQDAQKANRSDLVQAAEDELKFLETYLPQGLSASELKALAEAAIAEVGAKSIADLGKVMKILMPRLQGKASGDQVSRVVRELLTQ